MKNPKFFYLMAMLLSVGFVSAVFATDTAVVIQTSAPPEQVIQSVKANEQQQQIDAALKSILLPIETTRKNLLEHIAFYMNGQRESKKTYMFNTLVKTDISPKLMQVPSRFVGGVKNIGVTWAQIPTLVDTRDYYVRAFNEFAQAAESEIRAYKLGAMFWQANQELEMSKSQRDMAFEDAAQALAKNKMLFLQMGMKADDVQIKLIADELEALNKLKSSSETK